MASPVSQPRWYRGSHDTTGTHRTRLPGRPVVPLFHARFVAMKAMRTSTARST